MSPFSVRKGWIGVDLDGTLAVYDGWHGVRHIGAPVPAMVERVKRWLAEGREVRVFTARVSRPETMPANDLAQQAVDEIVEIGRAIQAWTEEHIGQRLQVTCMKDYLMVELWDDRTVAVETNTGRQLSPARAP